MTTNCQRDHIDHRPLNENVLIPFLRSQAQAAQDKCKQELFSDAAELLEILCAEQTADLDGLAAYLDGIPLRVLLEACEAACEAVRDCCKNHGGKLSAYAHAQMRNLRQATAGKGTT